MITVSGKEYELNRAWRWFLVGNAALNIFPSNIVINSLGAEPEHVIAQTLRIDLDRGDTLLVCSDGLHKNLSESEITSKLTSSMDPAFKLVEAAYRRSQDHLNRRMSPDDISVIVVRF
jgi:serine/threonine protein phosphatase PrpC